MVFYLFFFFFFKQKTAYEMRISDWSSDVCSSDLEVATADHWHHPRFRARRRLVELSLVCRARELLRGRGRGRRPARAAAARAGTCRGLPRPHRRAAGHRWRLRSRSRPVRRRHAPRDRSEEHTSELQSLMRISYAVFCLKKKKKP